MLTFRSRLPALLAVLTLTLGFAACGGDDDSSRGPDRSEELAGAEQEGLSFGAFGAPVTVHAFVDFSDPASRTFVQEVFSPLRDRFVRDGIVRFVHFDAPLGADAEGARLAHRAARCAADMGAFWAYYEKLFQRQPRWIERTDPTERLLEYGVQVGVDRQAMTRCMEKDGPPQLVEAGLDLADLLEVEETPATFVNGRQVAPTGENLLSAVMAARPIETEGDG